MEGVRSPRYIEPGCIYWKTNEILARCSSELRSEIARGKDPWDFRGKSCFHCWELFAFPSLGSRELSPMRVLDAYDASISEMCHLKC